MVLMWVVPPLIDGITSVSFGPGEPERFLELMLPVKVY